MASTVNISAIQAKRALVQLKEEGVIELKCEEIIIKNIEVVKKHISETTGISAFHTDFSGMTVTLFGEYLAVIQHGSNRLVYTKIVL